MIESLTTSTFRRNLAELLKVKRNVYAGVVPEISREFHGTSIEEIRQNRDMILIADEGIIIKLRLPDKKQRLSRKDGFRLIYLVATQAERVIFLSIYPKNGPSQKISISKEELEEIVREYIAEAQADALEPYDGI